MMGAEAIGNYPVNDLNGDGKIGIAEVVYTMQKVAEIK